MIGVKNLTNGWEVKNIQPTIFPDKTSQVWQLPEEVLTTKAGIPTYKITWHFESEAEIIHLLQLQMLLSNNGKIVELFIPYFPYARQDKAITNETTFAQQTILRLLEDYFICTVTVFDVHNPSGCKTYDITNLTATKYIVKSLVASKADLICFPDKGASTRYPELADFIVADKVRDQSTGKITGHELLETKHSLEGRTVLIADDLCDGGATFISMAKMLKEKGVANVDLYVSHGVFSNGVHVLLHAGIRNVYTTNSFIGSSQTSKGLVTIYNLED